MAHHAWPVWGSLDGKLPILPNFQLHHPGSHLGRSLRRGLAVRMLHQCLGPLHNDAPSYSAIPGSDHALKQTALPAIHLWLTHLDPDIDNQSQPIAHLHAL